MQNARENSVLKALNSVLKALNPPCRYKLSSFYRLSLLIRQMERTARPRHKIQQGIIIISVIARTNNLNIFCHLNILSRL